MVSGLRKLFRSVPLGTSTRRSTCETSVNRFAGELTSVLLPLGIRMLPLIPSPFLGGKLALAQRLMRRHKFIIPLLVACHRLVRRSRR
jgi:hypothetical protein